MSNLLSNVAGAFATAGIGLVMITAGNWKTVVEDIASPYTVTERAEYAVELPPPLRISLQGLGYLTLIGGTLYFIDRGLGNIEPILKQCAGSPLDQPIKMPCPPAKTKAVAPSQSQFPDHEEDEEPNSPATPLPSAYSPPIAPPDDRPQPTSWTVAPEVTQQPPEDDEWDSAPKIVVNRYPKPNADLRVTKAPEALSILDAAAQTDLHLLMATKSGAGKTTTILAILFKINEHLKGNVLFFLVDPKKRKWMGLEKLDNTYVTTSGRVATTRAVEYPVGSNLSPAVVQIERVYDFLNHRIEEPQGTVFQHAYLIIDEWVALYGKLKRGDVKTLNRVMEMLEHILTMGREFNVHLIVIGQSHLVMDCGFNTVLRQNFGVLCQGRVGEKNDVGYDPIIKAINDQNLIVSQEKADELRFKLSEAISKAATEGDPPVIMSTMGSPTIGFVEDFSWLKNYVLFEDAINSSEEQVDEKLLPSDGNYDDPEEYQKSLELSREFNEYVRNKKDDDFGAE